MCGIDINLRGSPACVTDIKSLMGNADSEKCILRFFFKNNESVDIEKHSQSAIFFTSAKAADRAKFLQFPLSCSGKNSWIGIGIRSSNKFERFVASETSHTFNNFTRIRRRSFLS